MPTREDFQRYLDNVASQLVEQARTSYPQDHTLDAATYFTRKYFGSSENAPDYQMEFIKSFNKGVASMTEQEYAERIESSRIATLKYRARNNIIDKAHRENANRVWRDENMWLGAVRDNMNRRKVFAKQIANVIKTTQPDTLERMGAMRNVYVNECVPVTWFRSAHVKQFGETDAVWKSEWIPPIWNDEPWFRNSVYFSVHAVHQSENDPTMIAYTRNLDGLKRDIQTRTRPGKYLTQFFSNVLSTDQIRAWAEKQVSNASLSADLKFIESDNEAGWIEVYDRGPNSCMKGDECVKVYAYPGNGLRLAYLETPEGDIVARAIVRDYDDGRKGYLRVYPNDNSTEETRWNRHMYNLLDAAGYGEQINLNNVKVQRINHRHDDAVMCPYIDYGSGGHQGFDLYDDHLLLGCGDFEACNTGGWVSINEGRECDCCGERFDEDDMTYIEYDERMVCESCRDDEYTHAMGRRYEDWFPNDEVIYCNTDRQHYHRDYANDHDVYECAVTDEWYKIEDLIEVEAGDRQGDLIHCDEAVQDGVSGEWLYRDDATEIDGKWINDEYVASCHVTSYDIDTRQAVCIQLGNKNMRSPFAHHTVPRFTKGNYVYVSADALTGDELVNNWLRCGDLLVPNEYFGNKITEPFEPSNVEYGDEYEGERVEDVLANLNADDEAEEAEAQAA